MRLGGSRGFVPGSSSSLDVRRLDSLSFLYVRWLKPAAPGSCSRGHVKVAAFGADTGTKLPATIVAGVWATNWQSGWSNCSCNIDIGYRGRPMPGCRRSWPQLLQAWCVLAGVQAVVRAKARGRNTMTNGTIRFWGCQLAGKGGALAVSRVGHFFQNNSRGTSQYVLTCARHNWMGSGNRALGPAPFSRSPSAGARASSTSRAQH